MYARTKTAIINGNKGQLVEVESAMTSGLPSFTIIGLANTTVKESIERIRASLKFYKISLPAKRIIVNLAPADIRKKGAHIDVSILVTLLDLLGIAKLSSKENCSFIGELALDGKILALNGILVILESLRDSGIERVVLPYDNFEEASYIDGIKLIPVRNIEDLINYINKDDVIRVEKLETQAVKEEFFIDYKEIKGQEGAKRALELAILGKHNLLLIGPPGTGKTMLIKNAPSLMPRLSMADRLEVAKLYGASNRRGLEVMKNGLAPFRAPHHSIGRGALIGGGVTPQPGEISLAHKGVLFLDELGEFKEEQLDQLREPLESGEITISRLGQRITFPADFLLMSAMNPCKCGYYASSDKMCTCSAASVRRGLSKLSKPFLDRVDMIYWVNDVDFEKLEKDNNHGASSTEEMLERIKAGSKQLALNRSRNKGLSEESRLCIRQGYERLELSPRTYHKVLRIAETIAAIEGSHEVKTEHLLEALHYRKAEKIFRGDLCI